jgi:ferredoxin
MPWIDKDICTSCGTCVEECPVDTIYMEGEAAEIDMENCIHCGLCHDVCPENAVKHDSEKIPGRIEANVSETKKFMMDCEKYLNDAKEKGKCLERMIRHFKSEKLIAERTLRELESIKPQFD